MVLRSEAVYRAQREVKKARRAVSFSDDLEAFLILLASYLWTGELALPLPGDRLTVNPLVHDYEEIGKAYLPINVKNPLSQVFATLLSPDDQKAFRDRFADGAARSTSSGWRAPPARAWPTAPGSSCQRARTKRATRTSSMRSSATSSA